MASSRLIGVVLFAMTLSTLEAYYWNWGPPNQANMTVCVGGKALIPWSIVNTSEALLDRRFWFKAPGKKETPIAAYVSEHFYTTDNSSRVTFLPNAGMSLSDARPEDSGQYAVYVQLRADNSLVSVSRAVILSVTDRAPATHDGALCVTSDAVRDDVTEEWTLQLHCGQFVDLGQPPVDVVWTTPSGEERNSSYQDNGTFVLSVSSPVQGGNYSCQLPPSAPAANCLTATSPLTAAAELYVDQQVAKLSFLEARQRELEQENKDQFSALTKTVNNVLTRTQLYEKNKDARLSLLEAHQKELEQEHKDQFSALTKTVNKVLARVNPANCVDWLKLDPRSAIRKVYIFGVPITVYCDQTTDNGGWIVFQRRRGAAVSFDQNWKEYRNGFGDLKGSFWLGLDKLNTLTTSQRFDLRVDLHQWDGTKGNATYSDFYVEDESHNFTLRFDKFTGGNAGNSLRTHRGHQFTTKDRDHDTWSWNCAQTYHGAWWYHACYDSNLNGVYKTNISGQGKGVSWPAFGGSSKYSMKFAEMKIRPI